MRKEMIPLREYKKFITFLMDNESEYWKTKQNTSITSIV